MGKLGSDFEKEFSVPDRNIDSKMSPETEQTMKDLFKEDFDGHETQKTDVFPSDINPVLEMKSLFSDDYSQKTEGSDNIVANETEQRWAVEFTKQYEPNSRFEVDGKSYNTDDRGYIYKIDGYELLPSSEYTIDGVSYNTDDHARIVSCDGRARLTPEGERDLKAQNMAGGDDRKPGDQGCHILARIFGGAKGIENMLAMRGAAINQSVYKRMENEIAKALNEGKEVDVHADVKYEGDSLRPSKITVKYTIDGKDTVVQFDNEEGSADLVDSLEGVIEDNDINDLKQEIQDANEDGAKISVVSVKIVYDAEGDIEKVTVTRRIDNSERPENKDRHFTLKEEA